MTPEKVLVIGPYGTATVYTSIRAASRVLSGKGTDSRRQTITRRLNEGGGYIGELFVQPTSMPGVTRT